MARITSGIDFVGNPAGLNRALSDAESSVKRTAATINGTSAALKVDNDTDVLDRAVLEVEKAARKINQTRATLKVNYALDDKEIRKVERELKRIEREQARAQRQQTAASRNNLATRFARSPGGTDYLYEGIASMGPAGVAAIAGTKIAETTLEFGAAFDRGRAARDRGDLEGEVAAERELTQFGESIPLVGKLGQLLNVRYVKDKEYIESITYLTQQQDKVTDALQKRAERARGLIEGDSERNRQFDREDAARDASGPERRRMAAEAAVEDEDRAQERRAAIDLDERSEAGRQAREVRDNLGRNLARARAQERAAERTRRSRIATERELEEEQRREEGRAEANERQRARRASRTSRARAGVRLQLERERDEEERRQGEAETREAELRAQRRDREADRLEIDERERQEVRAAEGDPRLEDQARRRAEADRQALGEDEEERRRAGEADTRSTELRAAGREGAATINDIMEQMRQGLRDAGDDPELQEQARRRAAAELQGFEREIRDRGRFGAEAVSAQTTDLTGRFSGTSDPGKETNAILKNQIAGALQEIANNTRNFAATTI